MLFYKEQPQRSEADPGSLLLRPEGSRDRPGVSVLCAFAMSASRSWQADSVDSGCSSYTQTSPPHPEPCCSGVDPIHGHPIVGQADPYHPEKRQLPPPKVSRRDEGLSGTPEAFARRTAGAPHTLQVKPRERVGRGPRQLKLTGSDAVE